MNYTKPKEQLLSEIRSDVYNTISYKLSSINFNNVQYTIQDAICDGIEQAFRTLLENTYTDQQFEEDTKLRT